MIEIIFKNLEPSEMSRRFAIDRIEPILSKFPYLESHRIKVTLSRSGDFTAKIQIQGKKSSISLKKENASLHLALADLAEQLLESLNHAEDKRRKKERDKSRNSHTGDSVRASSSKIQI